MVIPHVDGSLYAFVAGSQGVQKLGMTARQLVDAAPLVTDDGAAIVLGTRRTRVFVIDASSGALLRSFEPGSAGTPGGGGEDTAAVAWAETEAGESLGAEEADAIIIGRTEFTVRKGDSQRRRQPLAAGLC